MLVVLVRAPEPSALVLNKPTCFNIADIESRLPLTSESGDQLFQ